MTGREHFKGILAKSFFFLLNLKVFVLILPYWSSTQRTYHCGISIAQKAVSLVALWANTAPDARSKLTGCLVKMRVFYFPSYSSSYEVHL